MLLDAGDFSADVAPEAEARNRWVLKGLARMDYAAINIGELEVIEETSRWSELAGAGLPLVSTNGLLPEGSSVEAPPFVIREIESARGHDLKIGVLGVAAPASDSLAIEFAEPIASARRHAVELEGRVNLLVALVQMPPSAAQDLARAVPEIDVVIGAHHDTHETEPLFEGDTMILYPISQGMALGDLRLFFDDEGRPSRYFYRLVPLPAQLDDHPDWVEFQREAESEIEALSAP